MDSLQKRAEEAEEAEDLHTALELWKELAARDHEESFSLRYGRTAQKLNRWEEAESAFARALRRYPTSSLIMEHLGSLWASRTDKPEPESFQIAKQWFLEALKRERHARLLTQLGATYVALGESTAARGAFEEAVQLNPFYEEALYNLATLEEETEPQTAIDLLERAIQIDPDYAIAHQSLGRLHQKNRDLVRADYHFRRSLEIDPADYWSNIYLANLLAVQGKNSEAEQTYRLATTLHPEISGGLKLFANFLDSIGKPEEAAKLRANSGYASDAPT
jgi:tetratricopeptide (TPR) repeat protein